MLQFRVHCCNYVHKYHLFLLQPELVPVVAIVEYRCGHSLRVVADAAATKCQNQINIILSSNFNSLMQFLQRRVAHYAWVLHDGLASLFQDGHHLVIDAVAFHTAAAVVQQHNWTKIIQFVLEIVQRLITKI